MVSFKQTVCVRKAADQKSNQTSLTCVAGKNQQFEQTANSGFLIIEELAFDEPENEGGFADGTLADYRTGAMSEEMLNAYLDLLVEYSKSLETAQ